MTVEQRVRAMPKPDRVAYLRAAGWTRIGSSGAQSWRAPDPTDRGAYSLAGAIRAALQETAQ